MRNRTTAPIIGYSLEGKTEKREDVLPIEEPLEITLGGEPFYVTMRLPGEEIYQALGYCFTEGIIDSISDVDNLRYCPDNNGNLVDILINERCMTQNARKTRRKSFRSYSSCGICGKEMIEDIHVSLHEREKTVTLPISRIAELLACVENEQEAYRATRGTHAAAAFSRSGSLLAFSEDIGRHNALDKVIGKLISEKKTEEASIICITSRISYEMVQKAGRTGAEILIGLSSATSLAVDLAKSINLTIVGFAGQEVGKIYSEPDRIIY